MNRKEFRRVTAYHEAGHAVAALQLGVGIGCDGVSIVPGEDFAGFAHVLKGFRGRPDVEMTGAMRLKAENRVIVSLAGPVAQRIYRPSSVRGHHGRSDRASAVDLLSFFAGSTRELTAYLRWLQVRTEEYVGSSLWWTMIDAVADALIARDRLSVSEIKVIVRDSIGWPVPKPLKSAPRTGGSNGEGQAEID